MRYAALQRHVVAEAHAANREGFAAVTREQLRGVRAHARATAAQKFNIHYPELPAAGLEHAHVKNVPCWGNFLRFSVCCSLRNRKSARGTINNNKNEEARKVV